MNEQAWESDRLPESLEATEIHVWAARTTSSEAKKPGLEALLSDTEKSRAARFFKERDRCRYICAHAILRILVGKYLSIRPERVNFTVNAYGKPLLPDGELAFNISHSHDAVLLAFTCGCKLGVDLEWMDPDADTDSLAESVFSDRELEQYSGVPDKFRLQAFYNGWTRKEAFAKALGKGFNLNMKSFDVSLVPGKPARLLQYDEPGFDCSEWTMRSLTPFPGFAGAVVSNEASKTMSLFVFPGRQ